MSRSLPLDAHEHAEIVALCFATRPLLYPIVEHRLRFNNINNVIQKGPSVPDVTSLNMCVCYISESGSENPNLRTYRPRVEHTAVGGVVFLCVFCVASNSLACHQRLRDLHIHHRHKIGKCAHTQQSSTRSASTLSIRRRTSAIIQKI